MHQQFSNLNWQNMPFFHFMSVCVTWGFWTTLSDEISHEHLNLLYRVGLHIWAKRFSENLLRHLLLSVYNAPPPPTPLLTSTNSQSHLNYSAQQEFFHFYTICCTEHKMYSKRKLIWCALKITTSLLIFVSKLVVYPRKSHFWGDTRRQMCFISLNLRVRLVRNSI